MSDPQIGWTGLTPAELAARIRAHPFADVREPLMQKITLAALARALPLTPGPNGHAPAIRNQPRRNRRVEGMDRK
jgi:hypothetical protein